MLLTKLNWRLIQTTILLLLLLLMISGCQKLKEKTSPPHSQAIKAPSLKVKIMRDLNDTRYVCLTKNNYKKLMSYVLRLKHSEKSCLSSKKAGMY